MGRPRRISVVPWLLFVPTLLLWIVPSPAASAEREIPVMIQTVPPISGVSFSLDGRTFVTDKHGLGLATVSSPGTYELKILTRKKKSDVSTRVFSLWSDHSTSPSHKVEVETFTFLQAGFDTRVPIGFSFVDEESNAVDALAVESVTLVDELGDVQTVDDDTARINQTRVVATDGGIRQQEITYVVKRATVHGVDAATEDQVPFALSTNPSPEIELQLHDVVVDISDALFGNPLASTLHVDYPEGRSASRRVGTSGTVNLGKLPPGQYRVIAAGSGFSSSASFTPTESPSVSLRLISYADLAAVALVLIAAAGALVVANRAGLGKKISISGFPRLALPRLDFLRSLLARPRSHGFFSHRVDALKMVQRTLATRQPRQRLHKATSLPFGTARRRDLKKHQRAAATTETSSTPKQSHPPLEDSTQVPRLRFAQVIEGYVDDRETALIDWNDWCASLPSSGEINHTIGSSDDGRIVVLIFGDSATALGDEGSKLSAQPFSHFKGPAIVYESERIDASLFGPWEDAGCVQLIHGRARHIDRLEGLTQEMLAEVRETCPDVLGHVMIHYEDNRFTEAIYFTSEEDARSEERNRSTRLEVLTRQWEELVDDLSFVGIEVAGRAARGADSGSSGH